jgi:hypothetical protein
MEVLKPERVSMENDCKMDGLVYYFVPSYATDCSCEYVGMVVTTL